MRAPAAAHDAYPRYAHALSGAGAGLAAVALLHPLDTIRTYMQSATTKPADPLTFRGVRHVISTAGVPALYKGLAPASIGSILSWACYFHVVQRVNAHVAPNTRSTTVAHLISSCAAGIVTSVATNPIWVVKVRLQLQSGPGYSGFVDGLATIVKEEGFTGLYKGLSPSLWLVSHGAIQWTLYENIKAKLASNRAQLNNNQDTPVTNHISTMDALIASTASKLVASVSTYPLQVARTRMQERCADGSRYGSIQRALVYIGKTEGARGLYRGLSANIARVTPQAAVTFITYEQILRLCSNLS